MSFTVHTASLLISSGCYLLSTKNSVKDNKKEKDEKKQKTMDDEDAKLISFGGDEDMVGWMARGKETAKQGSDVKFHSAEKKRCREI